MTKRGMQRVSQEYNIEANDLVEWVCVREQTNGGTSWYELAPFGSIWDQLVSLGANVPWYLGTMPQWFHDIWLPWYHGIWQ